MIKDEMVYVDKTAFQKEIKKRGLTFVGVSCGLGRGKTYIRDHVCREGTLLKKDVQFIHKVFGINPNKYVTGEYDTATKRLNYALARVEDRALISRDKIVTALKNAGVTLVKASKDLGFSHAYINGLLRGDNPTAPVSMIEKFKELYGVDIRITPPPLRKIQVCLLRKMTQSRLPVKTKLLRITQALKNCEMQFRKPLMQSVKRRCALTGLLS